MVLRSCFLVLLMMSSIAFADTETYTPVVVPDDLATYVSWVNDPRVLMNIYGANDPTSLQSEEYLNQFRTAYMMSDNGTQIGYLCFYKISWQPNSMGMIILINPAYQAPGGQSYADSLTWMIAQARTMGLKYLDAEIFNYTTWAITLFENNGFVVVDPNWQDNTMTLLRLTL